MEIETSLQTYQQKEVMNWSKKANILIMELLFGTFQYFDVYHGMTKYKQNELAFSFYKEKTFVRDILMLFSFVITKSIPYR